MVLRLSAQAVRSACSRRAFTSSAASSSAASTSASATVTAAPEVPAYPYTSFVRTSSPPAAPKPKTGTSLLSAINADLARTESTPLSRALLRLFARRATREERVGPGSILSVSSYHYAPSRVDPKAPRPPVSVFSGALIGVRRRNGLLDSSFTLRSSPDTAGGTGTSVEQTFKMASPLLESVRIVARAQSPHKLRDPATAARARQQAAAVAARYSSAEKTAEKEQRRRAQLESAGVSEGPLAVARAGRRAKLYFLRDQQQRMPNVAGLVRADLRLKEQQREAQDAANAGAKESKTAGKQASGKGKGKGTKSKASKRK